MKKAIIYILFTLSIISGNAAETISTPIISPLPVKSAAMTQEIELLNIFKKEGVDSEKMEKAPKLKDIEKMQAIISKFLKRKDLDASFARQVIPSYFSLSLLTAKSPKDLDTLRDEIYHLSSTNSELAESLKGFKKNFSDRGSEALFTQTQALRDALKQKLKSPAITISAERRAKLVKENGEIKEAIRKNRAVVSFEHPTKEEFIIRRDTLAPFLERKDLEPETILWLLQEYNICAVAAYKTLADFEKSQQLLELLAQNYPKSAKFIRSVIYLNCPPKFSK